jgi:hypothetical protein
MKKINILVILLFISSNLFSQTIFNGKLMLKEGKIYNYKLVLNIDSLNSKVTGYSITDEKGNEETKSLLRGTFNKNKKKFFIKEYQIEKTKSKAKDIVFCFIEVELTVSSFKNEVTLVGQFTGKLFPTNQICGNGGVFVKEVKNKKLITANKIIPVKSAIKTTDEIKSIEKTAIKGFELVSENTVITTKSDSMYIDIWDQGKEDGDIVSVFVDGNLLVSNLTLTSVKKTYKIAINGKTEHIISILAENEGQYSPNTAAILLFDKTEKHSLICKSSIHEMKSIKIKK